MSAILAVLNDSAEGRKTDRWEASLRALHDRGNWRRDREFSRGKLAAVCPELSEHMPVPGADIAEGEGGVLVACHGSLYDLGPLYEAMAVEMPPGIADKPAQAILDAYLKWGCEAVNHWTGEASFTIWDPRKSLFVAGRDHLGTRPLFYYKNGEFIAVSTEISALHALSGRAPEPDPVTMHRFLCQGFFHDKRSFFLHMNRIQPGSMLVVRDGNLTETKYWRLEDSQPVRYDDPEEYGNHFVDLLTSAIRRRYIPSPGFGSGLSGGLDSSSLVCLAHKLQVESGSDMSIPVSSVVFANTKYDESRFVNAVMEQCGNPGALTSPDFWDIFKEWGRLTSFHDEPGIAMSAVIFLMQKVVARDVGIRVQLSGAGADEVMAGELQYFADLLRKGEIRELAREIRGYARVNSMGHSRGAAALFLRYAVAPLLPEGLRDFRRNRNLKGSYPWLGSALAKLPWEKEPQPAPGFEDLLHREMGTTLQSRYTPLLLHYEDRNSGVNGIESRFPFLDLEVVRFCFGLPREELMAAGHAKVTLKRGMRGILPDAVWQRQAKSGIPVLINRWLTKDYRDQVTSCVENSRLVADGWLDGPQFQELYRKYTEGDHGLRRHFWRALALEGWYRSYWP